MLQHYSGVIGTFDYDDTLWEIVDLDNPGKTERLRWIGGNQRCDLPKGCTSCAEMFRDFEFGNGFELGDFDTSAVTDMSDMFNRAVVPEDFSFGIGFDTYNVTTMRSMFLGIKVSGSVTFGGAFDASNVRDMSYMFNGANISGSLTLGDKFFIGVYADVSHIFDVCTIGKSLYVDLNYCFGSKHNVYKHVRMFGSQLKSKGIEEVLADWKASALIDYMSDRQVHLSCDCDAINTRLIDDLVLWLVSCCRELLSINKERYIEVSKIEQYPISKFSKAAIKYLSGYPEEHKREFITEEREADKNISFKDILNLDDVHAETAYDFSKLVDVPRSTLKFCKNMEELQEIVEKYCK